MNESIINPWMFYFAELFDTLGMIFLIIGGMGILCSLLGVIVGISEPHISEENENTVKTAIKCIIIFTIIIFIGVALPSKKTVYTMAIFYNVTPNNIESFRDDTLDMVDNIIDKINNIEKKKEE